MTWFKEGDEDSLWIPGGVVGIVISWVLSPVLSAVFAVTLFFTVRNLILRSKDAFRRSVLFYPVLVALAVWINAYFVVSKGIKKKICEKGISSWICNVDGDVKPVVAMLFSLGIGVGVSLVLAPFYSRITRTLNEEFEKSTSAKNVVGDLESTADPPTKSAAVLAGEKEGRNIVSPIFSRLSRSLSHSINIDPHESITTDSKVAAIHENAEKFDPKAEAVFRYIQIFTAIVSSLLPSIESQPHLRTFPKFLNECLHCIRIFCVPQVVMRRVLAATAAW